MARDRKRHLPVVAGHHPLMFWLEDTIRAGDISAAQCSLRAGISINAISGWRRGQSPSIGNFDAVLNVLGYRLAVVPLQQSGPIPGASVEAVA